MSRRVLFTAEMVLEEKWPVLGRHEHAREWLDVWANIGRAPRTIDAYARGLAEYLLACERDGVDPLTANRSQVALFVRDLRTRPSRRGANVVALSLLSSPPAHAATTGWQTVAPTYTRATVSYTVGVNNVKTVDYIGVSGRRKWIRDWEPSAGCVLEGWGVHALQVKNNGTTYISYPANTRPGYVNTDCGTYRTRYEVRPGFQGTNPSVYVSTTQWCPTGGSCSSWNAGITIGI
jgi:hypothetical protein